MRATADKKELWAALPSNLAVIFRPNVAAAAAHIIAEIQRAIPEYSGPLDNEFGNAIVSGVEEAILQFIDRLADPTRPQEERVELFRLFGRAEYANGRSLDTLQTAYRIGARVAWRRMASVCEKARLSTKTTALLAEAVFAYIDELATWSLEGFTAAQTKDAGAVERRRRRLLEMLLVTPPAPAQAIADLAAAARWDIPATAAAVALRPRQGRHQFCTPTLDERILMDTEAAAPCLLVPDPKPEDLRALESALRGWRAAVGPTVELSEVSRSLKWARQALNLAQREILPNDPIVWCDRHLHILWLLHDEELVHEIARRTLRPLTDLTHKQRTRLARTLLAWLEHRGNVAEMAADLAIHPQTVRYRVNQLVDLFGPALDDPVSRFSMEIALRALRSLDATAEVPRGRKSLAEERDAVTPVSRFPRRQAKP